MPSQFEIAIRHEVSVNRLASQIVATHINPAFININELVRRLMLDYDPSMSTRDYEALRKRTEKQLRKALETMWGDLTKDLKTFADYEAEYHAKALSAASDTAFATVTAAVVSESVNKNLMTLVSGDTVKTGFWPEWVAGNADSTIKLVDAEIRAGRAAKLGNAEIVKRITGLKKNNYEDGLLNKFPKNWAKTLVNTGASHYANMARKAVDDANADKIEGLVFSNVMDNRTSKTCLHYGQLARNGKVYAIDDPALPRPPLHPKCRSILIRKLKGVDPFEGKQSAVAGRKGEEAQSEFEARQARTDKKVKYRGRKDSAIFDAKQIDAKVSPQQFYSQQPDWYLESVFGRTGAKLFKDGKMPIEKFADTYGRPLTIKQMRELDEYDVYFDKAGL